MAARSVDLTAAMTRVGRATPTRQRWRALDAVERHHAEHDTAVEITGLNRESAALQATLFGQLAGAH